MSMPDALKRLYKKHMKELTDEFIMELKFNYPYYSSVYLTKIEAIREFREWWEKKEEV